MYAYIDVLFGVRASVTREAVDISTVLSDSDGQLVRNMPPYLLTPRAFCVAYADAHGNVVPMYYKGEPGDVLEKLDNTLYAVAGAPGNNGTELVGWNLDRVIIPSLAANAVMYGKKLPQKYFRLMSEKWSKAGGYSVERAFWQGWYSLDRTHDADQAMNLTLADAAHLSGIDDPKKVEAAMSVDGAEEPDKTRLAARLSVICNLFVRNQDLLATRR